MTKARDAKKYKKRELAKLEGNLYRCKAKMNQMYGEITRLRDHDKARDEAMDISNAIITLLLKHFNADEDHPAVLKKDDIATAMRDMLTLVHVTEEGEYKLHYVETEKSE